MAERDLKLVTTGWWALSTLYRDIPTPAGFWIVEAISVQLAAATTGTAPTTSAGLEIGLYDRSGYMPLIRTTIGADYSSSVFSDDLDNITVRGAQNQIHVAFTNPTATDDAVVYMWLRKVADDDV